MKKELLEILQCPFHEDNALLKAVDLEVIAGNIVSGELRCAHCKKVFVIKGGIPDFLPEYLLGYRRSERGHKTWKRGWSLNPLFAMRNKSNMVQHEAFRGKTVLDIGCGNNPQGDVNVDIYIPEGLRNTNNFILCAVEYLPFKKDSFDYAVSTSVLPYCRDPYRFFLEQIKVARLGILCLIDNCDWFGNFVLKLCGIGHSFDLTYYTQWSSNTIDNFLKQFNTIESSVTFSNQNSPLLLNIPSVLSFIPALRRFAYRHLLVQAMEEKQETSKARDDKK